MWLAAAIGTSSVPGGGGWPTYVYALLVFAGVVVTAVATYFGVKLVNSGGISTSTAQTLWDSANKMRDELAERLENAEKKADAATTETQAARVEALAARQEAIAARQEAVQWQQKALAMEADIERMKKQITVLQRKTRGARG
jgi:uncharacterized protein (DUF3084 family)